MAISNMRPYVASPAFTPSGYGLLSVIDWPASADAHWQLGVTWESVCPSASSWLDSCIVSGVGGPYSGTKAATWQRRYRGATPFTIYAEIDCSTPGFYDGAETAARIGLERSESFQLERILWTGTAGGVTNGQFPHLAANSEVRDVSNILVQPAATIVTGAAVDLVTGLGLLEQNLAACYNGVGVIHVPITAGPDLAAQHQLVKDTGPGGQRYRTVNGNLVSLGGGYLNTSPAGVAAGVNEAWLYATGPVFAYRGDVRTFTRTESLDRNVNTLKMIAERNYVVGFECCLLAIRVNL